MKRRALLSLAALILSGGCIGDLSGMTNRSHSITDREFTIYESGSPDADEFPGPTEEPIVSFKPQSKQVIVRGALYVGSSMCNKADLKNVSYNEDSQTLTVKVGDTDTSSWLSGSCTAEESADAYRLVVTMKEHVPTTVTVKHAGTMAQLVTVRRP